MLLLLEDNNDVARFKTRRLVALTRERYLLAVLHALIDVHLQYLSLMHYFLAIARLAHVLGVYLFALAVTFATRGVYLLIHASAELIQKHLAAGALACGALGDGACFAAAALAFLADDIFLQCQLSGGAVVQVLQAHRQLVYDVFALVFFFAASTATAAAAKEHVEYVHGRGEAAFAAAALLQALLAYLIVQVTLFWVRQDFIGLRYLLELFGGISLGILLK